MSQQQRKLMDERGYISSRHIASLLGVHITQVYRYIKKGYFDSIKINRTHYIRKSQFGQWWKDKNPKADPLTLAWLSGSPSGECLTCQLPIPITNDRCTNCASLDVRQESVIGVGQEE